MKPQMTQMNADKTNEIMDKMYDPNREKTYNIIGAAMAVHSELGNGFLEAVYGDALAIEFNKRGIPFAREKEIEILYKGTPINHKYYADFLCYDSIIVEIKAIEKLTNIQEAQVINYLKASNFKIGLLINFGESHLVTKRLVNRY